MRKILFITWIILAGLFPQVSAQHYSIKTEFHNGKVEYTLSPNLPVQPKIGLVLSGGGSRGLSHIGVIRVLDSLNIKPNLIVGTSIGSIVGGLYASGYKPEQIYKITKQIDWADIFSDAPERSALYPGQKSAQERYLLSMRLVNFAPNIPNAITPGQKVLDVLSDLFMKAPYQPHKSFDDLAFPFRSVATDIVSGEMIILDRGSMAASLNGSMAVPLLFSPVKIDDMLLVDGGIKSNLPASVAQNMGMDLIIASDVSATLRQQTELSKPWEVADQVTTIMTDRNNLKEHKNVDVLIIPELPKGTNTDFSKLDSLVQSGYTATKRMVQQFSNKKDSVLMLANRPMPLRSISYSGYVNGAKKQIDNSEPVWNLLALNDSLRTWMKAGVYKQIDAIYSPEEAHLTVTFAPFKTIQSIIVTGNKHISEQQILSVMKSQILQRLNSAVLEQDLKQILNLYRQKGYSLMGLKALSFNEESGALHIAIEEGLISAILVEGNRDTKDYVILREFRLQKHDAFNWLLVQQGIKNVYATALYDRVSVDVMNEQNQAKLIIRVDEKPSVRLRLGGKADLERRFQAYLELAEENLLGKNIKAKLDTRLGVKDGYLGLGVRNDRILNSFLAVQAHTYFSWEENKIHIKQKNEAEYREERLGLRLQVGQQLRKVGQLVGEVRFERVKDFRKSGKFFHENDLNLLTLSVHSRTDKRDRVDFPTSGIYNHWAWEAANSSWLKSQISYTKLHLNLEGYYELFKDHVTRLRFFAGLGDETLPFSEQFRVGGIHQFYGYLENELYGRQAIVNNFEYRYKLPFNPDNAIYIAGRFDFGAVWKSPNLIVKSRDFFSGFGVNIGVDTIFGPFFFGWGKSNKNRESFYLSLGLNY